MPSQFPTPARVILSPPNILPAAGVFPLLPGQGFLSQKSPEFSTTVQTAASFRESTASWAQYPRWHYQVAYEVIRDRPTQPELAMLYEFFCNNAGQNGGWWYFDPFDYLVPTQQFGTGDGVTGTFQLQRAIRTFVEPVYGVAGAPVISINGTPTTAFTVTPFGAVTFTTAPAAAAVLTWSGAFMRYCRFDQDQIDPEQLMLGLWDITKGIKFVSRKPY